MLIFWTVIRIYNARDIVYDDANDVDDVDGDDDDEENEDYDADGDDNHANSTRDCHGLPPTELEAWCFNWTPNDYQGLIIQIGLSSLMSSIFFDQ